MPQLKFEIESAAPMPCAVAPHLLFKLRIADRAAIQSAGDAAAVRSIALRCQIRIEPTRRRYGAAEQERLFELFGQPSDWSRTVHSMLWTHLTLNVPGFNCQTVVDMPVPCSHDFNIAATKYFAGLDEGEAPLCFLFSGTVFYEADGALRIEQISWEEEADFRLPAEIWRKMMEAYYPNTVWVGIHQTLHDQIDAYKRRLALPSWEMALERLLQNDTKAAAASALDGAA